MKTCDIEELCKFRLTHFPDQASCDDLLEDFPFPSESSYSNWSHTLFGETCSREYSSEMFPVERSTAVRSAITINDRQIQSTSTSSAWIETTNFPTVAFTDIKYNARETGILPSTRGKTLPPVGVFWDIENCSVPKGRSALVAVQRIRQKFFVGHVEAEFLCVCDIRKEAPSVIQELNDAQVSVIHVSGNSKNAADDKLRQSMRRFADISCSNPVNSEWLHPATVVLISGDINFVADLSDLRYRKRLYIILLHNKQTPDALLMCAHEHYEFHSILMDLPYRVGYRDFAENSHLSIPLKGGLNRADVILTELPLSNNVRTQTFIRNRLRKLSENCGGRVISIRGQWAIIRFPNFEAATRASKRMNGEDVLGNKIRVVRRHVMQESTPYNIGNLGGSSAPPWRPTWGKSAATEDSRFPLLPHPKPQSNSSSVESRNDSPTLPLPVQNSITQPIYDSGTEQRNAESASVTAIHADYLHQQQNASSYQLAAANANGGTAVPWLYSAVGSTYPNTVPLVHPRLHSNNSNFHLQSDPHNFSKQHIGNLSHTIHRAPLSSLNKSTNGRTFEDATDDGIGNSEAYGRFRNNDGDSFDLTVTNIDSSIGDWKAIRAALSNAFAEHVNVKGMWVSVANDGTANATVRLNSKDEAHYAVAQLHNRRKIGNRKIFISFDYGNSVDNGTLKKEVATLLQDVPNHTLPLFMFREMFEKRYKRSVSSSDLYRLKEVVTISESSPNGSGSSTSSAGRSISLAPKWLMKEGKGINLYCHLHPPKVQRSAENTRMGWAEKEAEVMLPNVIIEAKLLGTRIHYLLQAHDGGLPLISILDCYEAEFGPIELAREGRGVPLEHLLTCVQGVEIGYGENGMKRVQWHERSYDHNGAQPPLATQLSQFGRELIDLLKTFPKCTLPFSRLIPSYHAHFGRQCRVADYGHFSLIALLQSLPHIIQIMGAAQNRILTLSHRAQMKRFATDMLRVLKSQGGPKKQIRMDDFSKAFSNVFSPRQFLPEDYGLCFFSDLVNELVEHSTLVALVKDEEGQYWLAVPKREQTPHEMYKTRLFAAEVVELLRHSTRCELEFSKFVPYYHHHFQKQCKVSDYGFSKLVELFDAIADTVTIISPSGSDGAPEDKIIRLTPNEQIKVVGEQIVNIVEKRKQQGFTTKMKDLEDYFIEEHGFFLRPELCGASGLHDLVSDKLSSFVQVMDEEIVLVDRVHIEDLAQKAEAILQLVPEHRMSFVDFVSVLTKNCGGSDIDTSTIEKDLSNVIIIEEDGENQKSVGLNPVRIFAYEMTVLLEAHNGSIPYSSLESLYYDKFGRPLRPAQLGYPTLLSMVQAISDTVSVIGKQKSKRSIVLNSAKPTLESTSDDSSSSYGRDTPNHKQIDRKEERFSGSGGSSRHSKYKSTIVSRRRRCIPPPPPPLFSPLASPAFPMRPEVFTFDRQAPLSPPMYDMWVQETVAPGSPPVSPPVVWTCHPIFYPSSPPSAGPGNILVTSPYVTATPWSPPAINSGCYERMAQSAAPQSHSVVGNEVLFGQTPRLAASFDKLTVGGDENRMQYGSA